MKYNAENGYGLKLTKFDEEYRNCIIYRKTKREIIELVDNIICSFDRKGLLEELNEMQAAATYSNEYGVKYNSPLFDNIFKMPSYFINLLLEKHNMKVLGW